MRNIKSMSRGNALAPSRCNSVLCTARVSTVHRGMNIYPLVCRSGDKRYNSMYIEFAAAFCIYSIYCLSVGLSFNYRYECKSFLIFCLLYLSSHFLLYEY